MKTLLKRRKMKKIKLSIFLVILIVNCSHGEDRCNKGRQCVKFDMVIVPFNKVDKYKNNLSTICSVQMVQTLLMETVCSIYEEHQ